MRWLDLPHFFTIAIFLTMLIAAIQPVTDPDFWWHITTGNWILDHHTVPHQDLYTFTVHDQTIVVRPLRPSPTQWLHLGWTRRVVHLAA